MTAAAVIASLRAAGGSFMVVDGRLKIAAPSAPPPELIDRLKAHKAAILALLSGGDDGTPSHQAAPPPADDVEFSRALTLPILLGMIERLCCRRRVDDRRQRWLIAYDLSTDPPLIRLARALATVAPDLPALALAAENAADLDGLRTRLEAVLATPAGQAAGWCLVDQAEQVRR